MKLQGRHVAFLGLFVFNLEWHLFNEHRLRLPSLWPTELQRGICRAPTLTYLHLTNDTWVTRQLGHNANAVWRLECRRSYFRYA